jgi:hypothetical protein
MHSFLAKTVVLEYDHEGDQDSRAESFSRAILATLVVATAAIRTP